MGAELTVRGREARTVAAIVGWRLLAVPVILLAVAAMTFGLVAVSPFDPVNTYASVDTVTSDRTRADIATAWGLDASVPEQFARWAGNLARGDLGNARSLGGQPVAGEIVARAVPSMVLLAAALALVLVGGLVFGVLTAAFRGSWFDAAVRGLCYFNTAAPSFWIGLLALFVFAVTLGWLPAGGTADLRGGDLPALDVRYLILPALTLAATQYAWFTMFVRNTMLEVLRDDPVRFAEAQGIGRVAVLLRHALPNALIPFVTLLGTHLAELIGGAVLAETIFGWPGLGSLTVSAALAVDLPLLVAITLAGSLFVILGNLVADLLYRVVDPRVRGA